MPDDLATRAPLLLEDLGLARASQVDAIRPLGGGVASDIAVVELSDGRSFCVKFALARLKVAADWRAPVHRGRAEYHWLQFANTVAPGHVPRPYGWSSARNGIAMEFVAGPDVTLWKSSLLSSAPEQGQAAAVGSVLGRIHAASVQPGFDRSPFVNRDDFRALRIEPYLTFTATRHPDLAPQLIAMADALYAADAALVHGDVSPKNILFRGPDPILLDAECATMGDPAFDLAFCLNHLILKAVHLPQSAHDRLRGARELWQAYAPHVAWEVPATLEARVAALVPALMLARVDGKSPVEYLSEATRGHVRALSRNILRRPPSALGDLLARLSL